MISHFARCILSIARILRRWYTWRYIAVSCHFCVRFHVAYFYARCVRIFSKGCGVRLSSRQPNDPRSPSQVLLFIRRSSSLRNGDPSGPASKLDNLRGLKFDDSAPSPLLSLCKTVPAISRTVGNEGTNAARPAGFIFVAFAVRCVYQGTQKGAAYMLANIFRRPPSARQK